MYPKILGIVTKYVTVRRGLNGYRAITMTFDEAADAWTIHKRDPGTYAERPGAVTRATSIARAEGLELWV